MEPMVFWDRSVVRGREIFHWDKSLIKSGSRWVNGADENDTKIDEIPRVRKECGKVFLGKRESDPLLVGKVGVT